MIEQIKERFESGYYETNQITEEELYYISANNELFDYFSNYFLNSDSLNFEYNIVYKMLILDRLSSKYILENDDFESKKQFLYQYCRLLVKDGEWEFAYLRDISDILEGKISEEELLQFSLATLDEYKDSLVLHSDEEDIIYMINHDLFYLFPYLNNNWSYNFEEEITKKLLSAVEEGRVQLPSKEKALLKRPVEEFTLEELVEITSERSYYSFDSSDKYDVYDNELIRRVRELLNGPDEVLESYIGILYGSKELLNKELDIHELEKLFRKGLIFYHLPNKLIDNNICTSKEIYDIFVSIMDKSDNKLETFNNIFSSFYETGLFDEEYSDKVLSKRILGKIMIEKGYGLFLSDENLSENQINNIIQAFNEGKNKITHIERLVDIFSIDTRILKILFDNVKIDSIKLSLYDDTKIDFNDPKIKEKLELLHNFLRKNKNVKLDYITFFDKELFDYYVETGNYAKLATSINVYVARGLPEELLEWVNNHADNSFLYYKLIKNHSLGMFYNEKLFYPALKDSYLAELLIDFLVHNDKIKDKFSDEFYERVKYHFAKKYDLDVNKMDMLEKHFGPNIIMYIEDSNIQKILKMDEDKIKKIISLFPDVSYTLSDIEAGYESFNQYAYGRQPENTDVINIFPNLLRAVNAGNSALVKKYKYKLLSILDEKTISSIKEKKKFTGTTMEFIDYILSNLNEQENVDILHEVANNVILLDRKFYRNNHFYLESNKWTVAAKTKKTFENREDLTNLIINTSSSDLLEVVRKFGIFNAEDFYRLYESENPDDKLIIEAVIENLTRLRMDNLRKTHPIGYSIFDELQLEYDFDEKRKSAELDKFFMHSRLQKIKNQLLEKTQEIGMDKRIYDELFSCFIYDDFSDISPEAKKYIGKFTKIATEIIHEKMKTQEKGFDSGFIDSFIIPKLNNEFKLKRIFKPSKSTDLYPILMGLNYELIEKNIFEDENILDLYMEVMKSKKAHLLDPSFFKTFGQDTMPIFDDPSSLSGFINFFKVIVENVAENNHTTIDDKAKIIEKLSVTEILRQSSAYSAMSSIYSSILGREDAGFIKKNPDPNSSKIKNTAQRFTEAVEDTLVCYNKQSITTPTFDEIIQLSDGKTIEVTLGNFTSPCNITHGERTGACMRIGGVGEALYKFTLNDENGFHIRFEDPKTHKYISRVTGFRNGNTVYLNQLRNSLDKKRYQDSDLVEATEKIAKMLIEMTKDSDYPIENVFSTDGYALSSYPKKYKLDSDIVTKGLGKIYTDYSYSKACLLASTKEDGYIPLSNKKVNTSYQVQRSKPKIVREDMEGAPNLINRVHTIKQLLAGKKLEEDEVEVLEFKEDLLYCIANDDWYIYVDRNLEIKSEYIDVDPRAKEELDRYISIVEEMIQKGLVKEKSHEQL